MPGPTTFREQLDGLAYGEVRPLLLATDIERGEQLAVHVVLLDPNEVTSSGHTSSLPIFTRRFPYPNPAADAEFVRDARQETITRFADRLRELVAD